MILVDKLTLNRGEVFCAFAGDALYPANGGLRVMNYSSSDRAREEAVGLAEKMIQKHAHYHTGFSGGKIVANVPNFDTETIGEVIERVGSYLNECSGRFLTGCDLNFGEAEALQLADRSRHVLAALHSKVHYAEATAAGINGSVQAVIEQEKMVQPRILVHGCGAVGSRCARDLAQAYQVYTLDLESERADIPSCTNVSEHPDWREIPIDLLVLVSASRLISISDLNLLSGKAIVCGANIPFFNEATEAYARQHFRLVDEGIASAGAVIADSIEYYKKALWDATSPDRIYRFIRRQVFRRTTAEQVLPPEAATPFIGQLIA